MLFIEVQGRVGGASVEGPEELGCCSLRAVGFQPQGPHPHQPFHGFGRDPRNAFS